MLTAYLTQTRRLLQNPAAPAPLYATADLTDYINSARGQLAGEAECVRFAATLATVIGTATYNYSAVNTGISATNGIQGVLNVRMIRCPVSGGFALVTPWPWEWFNQYYLAQVNIANARPKNWAQYAQGAKGSAYFSPTPDAIYTLQLDTVCYPIDLVNDTTVEAIPYPWTDAVPYFAAYLALMASQTGARDELAERMFKRYEDFVGRARRISTPTVMPYQYEQTGERSPPPPASVGAADKGGR